MNRALIHHSPWYKSFITLQARIDSFEGQMHNFKSSITPLQFAEAGFFKRAGDHDIVTCFHCDVSLYQWDETDCPWEEHAKYHCPYLRLNSREETSATCDELRCKVCMDKQVGVVLTGCGHMVTCRPCTTYLETCPVCRALITMIMFVYFG